MELQHERDDIKGFYSKFQGEVIVGIEACGYTNSFEELMEQLGHKLLVGDAAEIRRLVRRRQKNDRRDADLLLELLVRNEFPALFRYDRESRELLRQLRYRHKLVKLRTMVVNTLHALAILLCAPPFDETTLDGPESLTDPPRLAQSHLINLLMTRVTDFSGFVTTTV